MEELEDLKDLLMQLEFEKSRKENELEDFEIPEDELDQKYDELLDSEGIISIGQCEFYPSAILKEMDPIAYNVGLSDFSSEEDPTEHEDYKALKYELEEIEDKIYNLNEEIGTREKLKC